MKKNQFNTFIIAAIFTLSITGCNNSATNEEHGKHMKEDAMEEGMGMENGEMKHKEHGKMPAAPAGGSSKSPRKSAMVNIGDTHVHIDYAAPSMRGRQIFGGLVAYNEPWTPGAHKATTIEFYDDVLVEGRKLSKGKYGLFTIPGKDEWTIMINKNNDMHLADDYSQEQDVLRFQVKPEKNEPVEQLSFDVKSEGDDSGKVILRWADVQVSFTVKAQ